MANRPIEIQFVLPNGNFALANRTVKLHSTGFLGGTNVSNSGSTYTTQINGIVQLPSDWRGNDITHVYFYDDKGKKVEYTLRKKVYLPKDKDGPIKVDLKK